MPITNVQVVATHHLQGPKDRRYVFRLLVGSVQVERWEGPKAVSRTTYTLAAARKLYKYLVTSCGYQKW